MIREPTTDRVAFPRKQLRQDGPALVLPRPHFDATRSDQVLEFLDSANRKLIDRNTSHQVVGQTIWEICGVLHLRRRTLEKEQWQDFVAEIRQHPIRHTLHEDEFTRRAFDKPRGYQGDAVLLDYIYGTEHFWSPPEMNWVGQRIFRWSTESSACVGVRERRSLIAALIDDLARHKKRPDVMSLAAGHFREAEICSAILRRQLGRMFTIDSDEASLRVIEQEYGRYGVQTVNAAARELITGKLNTGTFDLIYTSGLCDYLSDSMCQRLAHNLFERLNPGGKLLLTNFVDNIETVGYMEAFMDWNLIWRNRLQMVAMTARIPEAMVRRVTCYSEENRNVIFLVVERN